MNRHVTENRLADIAGKTRNVPENCDLLTVARRMGISLADFYLKWPPLHSGHCLM